MKSYTMSTIVLTSSFIQKVCLLIQTFPPSSAGSPPPPPPPYYKRNIHVSILQASKGFIKQGKLLNLNSPQNKEIIQRNHQLRKYKNKGILKWTTLVCIIKTNFNASTHSHKNSTSTHSSGQIQYFEIKGVHKSMQRTSRTQGTKFNTAGVRCLLKGQGSTRDLDARLYAVSEPYFEAFSYKTE